MVMFSSLSIFRFVQPAHNGFYNLTTTRMVCNFCAWGCGPFWWACLLWVGDFSAIAPLEDGCQSGFECAFCHLCPPGTSKKGLPDY